MHSWRSNYRYSPALSCFIESCFSDSFLTMKDLANKLGISLSYAYFILKKLKNDLNFTLKVRPYYEKLGLRFASCFLSVSQPRLKSMLFEVLSSHEFTSYIAYCDGDVRGLYCDFLIPYGRENDIIALLELCSSYNMIDNYVLRFTSSPYNIIMGFRWYDHSRHQWNYMWDDFVCEVEKLSTHDIAVPAYLYGEQEFKPSCRIDKIDLLILHHMEHDAMIALKSLASLAKVTPQDISYHFKHHVIKLGLIKSLRPYWLPIPLEDASIGICDINFTNVKGLTGFIKALSHKPIARDFTLYMLDSAPSAIIVYSLPFREVRAFIRSLERLQEMDIIKKFSYIELDITMSRGKALPYMAFNAEKGWLYNLDYCIEQIMSVAKSGHVIPSKLAKAAERTMESK